MTTIRTPLPVSVVLPTHGRTAVLRRAIRSVLAQTQPPLELIVVDDASTEDVRAVIDACGDDRIRYFRMAERAGAGAARNFGVQQARGEWIAFQDSDDEWLIDKLERQWQAAAGGTTEAALICGAYLIVPRRGAPTVVLPTATMRGRTWPLGARFGFPFIAPTWMVRRSVFLDADGFDSTLPNLEDWEFSFRLHDRGGFIAIDAPLLVKHGSADGLNQDAARQLASLDLIGRRHAQLFEREPAIAARLALWRAHLQARLGAPAAARRGLGDALGQAPSLRTALLYGASLAGARALRLAERAWRRPVP